MTDKNRMHSTALRQIADVYDAAEFDLSPMPTYIHTYSKEELIQAVRAVGGKFKKTQDDTWVRLESQRIPGLTITIFRDVVCEKIVTYKCQPLLSPDDEAEVMEIASIA